MAARSGERIDRSRSIRFSFDGRRIDGYAGDTIASAMYAAGERTFSRSFKYHRRRGLLCVAGQCPNCLCAVDGVPGVRACTEPARDGMSVTHVNAWPSLRFDAMRAVDLFGSRLTPPGFYYKTFIRPRALWPVYERVLRHAAGLGRLPREQAHRKWRTEYRRRHADVLVVGGGPAGVAAAQAAARLGADVVLAGGSVEAEGVEVLRGGVALGYFDGLVPVWQGDTLHQVRARRHVIATGTIEQPLVFAGNDLPGVMLAGGARRLAERWAVSPGRRAVVATTSDRGLETAVALRAAGVEIAAVADLRPGTGGLARELRASGVPVFAGQTVVEARGGRSVRWAVIAPVGGGDEHGFACDLVVVSGGAAPAASLLLQAGARTSYDPARGVFAVTDLPDGIDGAGAVMGDRRGAEAGELAGLRAAHALGLGDGASRGRMERLERAGRMGDDGAVAPAVSGEGRGKCFACLCEDVTSADIRVSVAEGYDSIELAKRYTTATMGPCQGRMCQLASVRLMARETGRDLGEVGTTTARPPWTSVPLGVLAGRSVEPAKRSSMHERHVALGATIRWAGDWYRAYDYGDPHGEALAVHRAAGLIDVSMLGKLIVRGAAAGAFLDRMYPNRLSNLAPGRIRYGVISSDAGRILDDGTVCRIDEETFYVTTTSSGAGAMYEWFSWWLADGNADADVTLTDVTPGVAAVNLAGPRARSILAEVGPEVDWSAAGFRYLDARSGRVAGVECLILRIGFVGEVGFEIHFPSAYGEHIWDALMVAGRPHGLRPFGLEPQRILRLQKMHILVGQDTDSESTPFGAGMSWIVKLDKEQDFIGKWALQHYAQQTPATVLVGFTVPTGEVPAEGAVVVDESGAPAGQVTSSRYSPALDRTIGMAWVPEALARDGTRITVSDAGRTLTAEVQTTPFYDPDGAVLRS